MTATATPIPSGAADRETTAPATTPRRRRVNMRWKMLGAFAAGFTVVFAVLAVMLLRFFTGEADDNLRDTLEAVAVGGAQTIEGDLLPEVIADLPTRDSVRDTIGTPYPPGAGLLTGTAVREETIGYPADPRYWALVGQLVDIRRTNPEASPYIYAHDGNGELAYVTSWAARGKPTPDDSPAAGVPYLISAATVGEEAVPYLLGGMETTTEQPGVYTDEFGEWISVYTPIRDSSGEIVGGLGVDYYYRYVSEVQSRVMTRLLWLFGIAYVVLLVVVVWLSGWLTRRLARLSTATRLVADGDYHVDLTGTARSHFADEMTDLADAFEVMVSKVDARERTLTRQVQVLKVEIDEQRRKKAVAEITDTDFFADLTAKADSMRRKIKASDEATGGGTDEPAR